MTPARIRAASSRVRPVRLAPLSVVTVAALVTVVTLSRADAPAGHYSALGGSVIDSKTGLQWGKGATGPVTWDEAVQHCASFSGETLTDWRLPSMKELQTLVDEAKTPAPLIDPLFTGAEEAAWSSSEVRGGNGLTVYAVNFGGNGDAGPKYKTDTGYARCVRP